jgi:Kef-type K+ transport system membrane component KefB
MTAAATQKKGLGHHLTHAVLLGAFTALIFYVTRAVPEMHGSLWTIASIGFLLVAGTLTSELLGTLGLPHLTGYLLAGVVAGPHILRLVDEHTVKSMSPVNTLALALIALAGGAELDLSALKQGAKGLAWAMAVQCLLVLVVLSGVFVAARPLLPFARALPVGQVIAVGMLWGALAVTRSPAATLAILSQTRARGPVATFTLGFVMVSDVVVVVLIATVLGCTRSLFDPSVAFSAQAFAQLGKELFGSVALGTSLGLFIAVYLRMVNRQMLVVLLVLGFGVSTVLDYLQLDSLLTFIMAGFIVRNMSNQGKKFIEYIEQTATVVYVVFFATAGADLDVPLIRLLWPVALLMAGTRAGVTWVGSQVSGLLAKDSPVLRRWSWTGLVSQAGLALGLSVIIAKDFPTFGPGFRSLAIATIAVNEVVGPIFFKLALDRTGETSHAEVLSLASLRPPPPDG